MIHSSWGIVCDRMKLVIMGYCLPIYPLTPKNQKKNRILKWWNKLPEILSFYMRVPKSSIIWDMVPKIQSETDFFCHFGTFFYSFTCLTTWKTKILKKWKNYMEMSSFYTCLTKITIILCMLPDTWSATDIIFGPLLPPPPQKLKFLKNLKNAWRYSHFPHVWHKWRSYEVWFLSYKAQWRGFLEDHFWSFDSPNPKDQNFEKMTKH